MKTSGSSLGVCSSRLLQSWVCRPHQLSELAAVQGDTPQPTLEQDLQLWKQHVGIQQGNGNDSYNSQQHAALSTLLQATLMLLL